MTNFNIEIKNLNKFKRALRQYPEISAPLIKNAIAESIYDIQREAVPRTPVKTGALRRSYRARIKKTSGTLTPDIEYAYKQHEGFYKHPRGGERKFLEKGVKASIKKIQKIFTVNLDKILGKIARKTNF